MTDDAGQLLELLKTIGAPTGIVILGWWMRGQFTAVRDHASKILKDHETLDERRHVQNLMRFSRINAKLGIRNVVDAADDTSAYDGGG